MFIIIPLLFIGPCYGFLAEDTGSKRLKRPEELYHHYDFAAYDGDSPEVKNLTTMYVPPVFNRFCNDCEDYWHIKCSHYPHIYDDPRGCVVKTLSPDSVNKLHAENDVDEDEDEEYYSGDSDDDGSGSESQEPEYEEAVKEQNEKEKERKIKETKQGENNEDELSDDKDEVENEKMDENEEGKPKQKPEVLMKAADVEKMREKLRQIEEAKDSANITDQKEMNNIIQEAIKNRVTSFVPDEENSPLPDKSLVESIEEITLKPTTLYPGTVWMKMGSSEPEFTILQEQYDDMNAFMDTRMNNALKSCPKEFAISQSKIPELKLGVWTTCDLPQGVVFGPLRGRVDLTNTHEETEEKHQMEFVLRMYHPKTRALLYQIDARKDALGNWCRYINAARHQSEENVEMFFHDDLPFPFFRTLKHIPKHTEILTDFGPEYRKEKYISLFNVIYDKPLMEPLPCRKFLCSRCEVDQGCPVAIKIHRKNCTNIKKKMNKKERRIFEKEKGKKGKFVDEEQATEMEHTTYDKETLDKIRSRFNQRPNMNMPNNDFNRPNNNMPSNDFNRPNFNRPNNDFNRPNYNMPNNDFNRPNFNMPNNDFNRPNYNMPNNDFNRPNYNSPANDFNRPNFNRPNNDFNRPNFNRPNNDFNRPNFNRPTNDYNRSNINMPNNNNRAFIRPNNNRDINRPNNNRPFNNYFNNYNNSYNKYNNPTNRPYNYPRRF